MLWKSARLSENAVDLRPIVAISTGAVVTFSVVVLWYVATFPDIGLRCLLPTLPTEHRLGGVTIQQQRLPDEVSPQPSPGDRLVEVNGKRVTTFLDFVDQLIAIRSAKIAPGGQLSPGSDPSELPVPPIVEVFGTEPDAAAERMVEIRFHRQDSVNKGGMALANRIYLPVHPVEIVDISMTIFWFVCQLAILGVALAAYWHRPFDRVAQNFCLMSCASMGAFVGGFHWWILTGSPLLNIPFIICAMLLPAMVLNFFLVFPVEPEFIRERRRTFQWILFGPAVFMTVALVIVYWSAWCLNGTTGVDGTLNALQKTTLLARYLAWGGTADLDLVTLSTWLLYALRCLVHIAIGIAAIYFMLTVAVLATSLFRINAPRERSQVLTILAAAAIASIPIGYTLFLAMFESVAFALGAAHKPMFAASMIFMAAYANGMLRHRLILADDTLEKSRRYSMMSLLVSGGFCTCLAIGGVAAHAYNLPLNSSTAQQISLFLILLLAASLSLWVRDRLQSVVDRRFFSEKYQLDRTLQQLNRAAGYLADPSVMSEITLRTCQEVIDASSACMYVRDGSGAYRLIGVRSAPGAPSTLKAERLPITRADEMVVQRIPSISRVSMSPVQQLLHELKAELACFLEDEGGLHGLILVGRRKSGTQYTAEDIAFLHAIGQMSVLALHSSRANQTMARLDAELKVKVDRIAEQQRQVAMLRAELTSLQRDAGQTLITSSDEDFDREGIRGNSTSLAEVLTQVRKVSRSLSTVLVRGESGTGKELLARVIHRNSDRRDKPLICVNCAALSSSLLESELFGHVKGAFTGAHADKEGRFQAANGGTLFLDEIGDVSHETQVKLLRVLQERCFEPVGSDKTVHVDVRLIAATNRDLEAMIAKGDFREDLFYRLNVVSVTLPPLRERREDLIELVFFFLSRSSQKARKQIRQIEPDALEALEQHTWPGNVRELENVMERAVVMADSDVVTLADLPLEIRKSTRKRIVYEQPIPMVIGREQSETISGKERVNEVYSAKVIIPDDIDPAGEAALLKKALRDAAGNKALAARHLNLPRSTFYSKCKKYRIS
ncbi:MAG: sigma 54-interacting transcriptional regulator [Planctomycetaceae bacterium]|nr:sigma 54-interacting transcriptional regulator [Planctomycetaceae bacterium]